MNENNKLALEDMAKAFKAMGDFNRLRIIGYLASSQGGRVSVSELCEKFSITQPAISQHLKNLMSIGLVKFEKQANFRYYSLDLVRFAHIKEHFLFIYDLAFRAWPKEQQ